MPPFRLKGLKDMTQTTFVLPGVLESVPPGMQEAILIEPSGFISRGLESLFLFEEASGTALVDEQGGASGVIDSLASSNNAYSRLAGGGISLSGAQLASFPLFEQAEAWTLFAGGRVTGGVGSAPEKIVGHIGTRNFGAAQVRGAYLYQRGQTDLSVAQTTGYYQSRASNGSGAQGASSDLLPTGIATAQRDRLLMLSYNGVDSLEARAYDGAGQLMAASSLSTNDATLFTISGVTLSAMQWALGGVSGTYASGVQRFEFAGRYSRALASFSTTEIAQMAAAAAAIGEARGRAWS